MKAKVLLIPDDSTKYTGDYGDRKIIMIPAFEPNKWYLSYDDNEGISVFAAKYHCADVISDILTGENYDLRYVEWNEEQSRRFGFNPFKKFDREDHWKKFTPSIYFFYDESTTRIKIGTSENHLNRMRHLNVEHNKDLILLGVMDGDYQSESIIHNIFIDLRVTGEWFKDNDTIRDFVTEYCYMPPAFQRPVKRKTRTTKIQNAWWRHS